MMKRLKLRRVKNFYIAGFDAMSKQWDKSTNVGGGYVKK
jgi:hypothetical protein